jgi:SAM-dependent methyltransferase
MNRTYWNRMAACYEAEIFSVLEHDRAALIASKVARYGKKSQTATDIGCGIGHILPLLSKRFRKVRALDLSAKCIAKAQARHHLPNVEYRAVDLATPGLRLPPADFALCVNSAIAPSIAHRNRLLDVTCRHIRPGGHLVLAVPALESSFLVDFRLIEWNLREGMEPRRAVGAGFRAYRPTGNPRAHEGVVRIDQVETKHFLKEEVMILLENRGLRTLEIEKIEYPWKTEFADPPRWMQAPFPWDWLFVAQKRSGRRIQ